MNNKQETSSATLFTMAILGIFFFAIILEPIVLYKTIKKKERDALDILAMIISATIVGFFTLSFFIGMLIGISEAL